MESESETNPLPRQNATLPWFSSLWLLLFFYFLMFSFLKLTLLCWVFFRLELMVYFGWLDMKILQCQENFFYAQLIIDLKK